VIRIVINQCLKLKFKSHPSYPSCTSWRYQHTIAVLVTTSLGCKGDILQTWRVDANMLNGSSWIHNNGPTACGLDVRLTNPEDDSLLEYSAM
jgi:hypothetical protein